MPRLLQRSHAHLQDIAAILPVNRQLLTETAAVMAPFSLDYTTTILDQYMHLFCHTARLYLLLRFYPGRLIVQLYSLVHSHARLRQKTNRQQEQADRYEMVQLVSCSDNAVPLLQREFQPLTARLSQASLSWVMGVINRTLIHENFSCNACLNLLMNA